MTAGNEGHRQRLRERFGRTGLDGFHDHEVLEFILSYGIPRKDVKPIAKELLSQFGSLASVLDTPVETLQNIDGVGPQAALLMKLIPRLIERYQSDRWKQVPDFKSTLDAVNYLSPILRAERNEVFYLLALNSKNGLIKAEEIQRGSVNRTAVFPRLVVETSLKHRATAVILAHNHPGGDATPSEADRQLTLKLRRILSELDILVHDHIIIAGPHHYSFAENGGFA